MQRRIVRDPGSRSYTDLAIAPVDGLEVDLDLYRASEAARQVADRARARRAQSQATAVATR